MIVKEIEEYEDGSARMELSEISKDELQMLVQAGLIALLNEWIEREKENKKIPAVFKPIGEGSEFR